MIGKSGRASRRYPAVLAVQMKLHPKEVKPTASGSRASIAAAIFLKEAVHRKIAATDFNLRIEQEAVMAGRLQN